MKTRCNQINSGIPCGMMREGSEKLCPDCNPRPDLTAIVRSSIVAYNEGRAGNPYHPGYTEHERIAWEAGHSAGGWGGKH